MFTTARSKISSKPLTLNEYTSVLVADCFDAAAGCGLNTSGALYSGVPTLPVMVELSVVSTTCLCEPR
jgi:hypothetical protein